MQQETNADNKKAIVNALFIQDNATALVEIARKETDLNLKKAIVNQLSVMHLPRKRQIIYWRS